MSNAMTVTATAGPTSTRGHRAASLRNAVGVRGHIPPAAGPQARRQDPAAAPMADDVELVAARGRRVAALRSRVATPGRTVREARSGA